MTNSQFAFSQSLLALNKNAARIILDDACHELSPVETINTIVSPVLEDMGRRWEHGNLALSQLYMCGRICEKLIDDMLDPVLFTRKSQPKIAIASLIDYHMLGKNLVRHHLRSSGFEVLDYGRTDIDELVRQARNDRIEVIMISTLMLSSAKKILRVREQLDKHDIRPRIIVGGAPFLFDADLWKEVGADAMGRNSTEAVELIEGLCEAEI
jgi:methanogenic corrinoid protein MtbC1